MDKPGYLPAARPVEVAAGAAPQAFELQATSGIIRLEHLPATATVYLDGSQVDLGAPLSAPVGPHRIRVEAGDEVIFSKTLTVHGGEQVLRIGGGRSAP